jgi:hypothetical protein
MITKYVISKKAIIKKNKDRTCVFKATSIYYQKGKKYILFQ